MGVTRRYTEPQRDAIVHAVLVDGLSRGEAQRRAEAGTLADALAPFRIPYSSTVAIVAKASESFFAEQMRNPAHARAVLDADALRLVELAHTTVEKVTAAAKKAGGNPDPVAVKRAAEAITSARRALPPERPATKPTAAAESFPVEPDGTLATLLAHVRQTNGHTPAETPA